jgi:hypothetical protein
MCYRLLSIHAPATTFNRCATRRRDDEAEPKRFRCNKTGESAHKLTKTISSFQQQPCTDLSDVDFQPFVAAMDKPIGIEELAYEFCKTVFPGLFTIGWSKAHQKLIKVSQNLLIIQPHRPTHFSKILQPMMMTRSCLTDARLFV